MRNLLAVDLSNQIYKAAAVNSKLTSGRKFTGGLYGFVDFLARAIKVTEATSVVICKDCPPYLRSATYPVYKKLREKSKDEDMVKRVVESKRYLDELFDIIGIPVLAVPGFECDDLIALLVHKYRHRYGRIIAASNDSDLYQLFEVSDGFSIYKGKKGFYDHADFKDEWDLSREQFMTAHALMGTHNDIEGIPGVGPVTAKKIVRDPVKLRTYQGSHKDLIQRNYDLISLPHADLPFSTQLPVPRGKFKEREFIRFLGRFDIQVTQTMITSLEKVMG